MDVAYNRHSRRSTTNLHHLSLAPLTSKFPIGDEEEISHLEPYQRVSYLEGKSAPTTPGILSRSPSSSRLRLKPSQSNLPKSMSSSQLQHKRTKPARNRTDSSSEWIHRAGAAISWETRESKGQTWLVSRASSTSLVDNSNSNNDGRESISFADDEFSPNSARASHLHSRTGSRIHSRFTSRQGSRVGSKQELMRGGLRGDGSEDQGSVFEDEIIAEPDFVDMDEDAYDEAVVDAEIDRLTKLRGLGLGNWLDRMIGWPLFTADEEIEETDEGLAEEEVKEREIESTLEHTSLDKETVSKVLALRPEDESLEDTREEGGWQDAAWLLSVATKILL